MKVQQRLFRNGKWVDSGKRVNNSSPQLGFLFGSIDYFLDDNIIQGIREEFPDMILAGCTSAGEISNSEVTDQCLVLTALEFEKTEVKAVSVIFDKPEDIYKEGKRAAQQLPVENLSHVIVLAEGIGINGSNLVQGIVDVLPPNVQLTGGLAANADKFDQTYTLLNNKAERNNIVLLAFYGAHLEIGSGCYGGWDPFGPDRLITEAEENILYEFDHEPALDLYKKYLGDYADKLPASGLLFPICVMADNRNNGLVRSILGIDEEKKSITFAGDIKKGKYSRLMKANNTGLINGAHTSAKNSIDRLEKKEPEFALAFSCIGRKVVLKQRVEEELEALRDVYGDSTTIAGLYSYGEIAPFDSKSFSSLHNQTMCITTFSER